VLCDAVRDPASEASRAPPRRIEGRAFAPAVLAALIVALLLLATSPPQFGSTVGSAWTGGHRWSNGVFAATFATDRPAATIAPMGADPGYGLYAGVASVAELSANGSAIAIADLTRAAWTVDNATTSIGMTMTYATNATVRANGSGAPVGASDMVVSFTAGAAAPPTARDAGTLSFSVALTDWPWQGSGDSLMMSLPLWPSDPATEYLADGATPGTMDCMENSSHRSVEYFAWDPTAIVGETGPATTSVAASATVIGGSSAAAVQIHFASSAGAFRSLVYEPRIGLSQLPGSPPLPLADYALIAGGLAALTVGLAALMLRVGRRPPRLLGAEGDGR
jgi:hypothetical protein